MAHGVEDVLYEGAVSPNAKHCEKKATKAREGRGAGSRRIFSPRFKLQVLDSYRKDSDCRGNQRATARKYGIHRRQIQKWLQMESTLRCNAEVGPPEAALNLARQRDSGPARPVAAAGRPPSPPTPPVPENDYIDVDKISDSEDDVSSECSFTDPDRALDFTCAALSKRRFFSVSFKLEVLNAFYNDALCKGNQRATARKFGIHRRQVQKWLDHEQQLRTERIGGEIECAECLDLSKKRRLECLTGDKSCGEERRVQSPSSVQETALCLIKQPAASPEVSSTVDLYRPYNLSPSPPESCLPPPEPCLPPPEPCLPTSYDSSCCSWTSYYPYYGVIHSSYVSPWLPPPTPTEVHYYKQPLQCLNLYTPMYTS